MARRILVVGLSLLAPIVLAASFPNIQTLFGVTTTTNPTAEVLVLASAATEIPALPNRAGIEIQNLGPNAIYCSIDDSTKAVVTKSRMIAASGGTWALGSSHKHSVWCRAATADQVTGAATIVSQYAR
jgi:hypothetical protein